MIKDKEFKYQLISHYTHEPITKPKKCSFWFVVSFLVVSNVFNIYLLLNPCRNNIKHVLSNAFSTANLSSLLPQTIAYNDSEILEIAEESFNIPGQYYDRWSKTNFGIDAVKLEGVTYCDNVQIVSPHLLHQNNLYWQVLETSFNNTPMMIYLYNSYYDDRISGKPVVRLITVTDRQKEVGKVKLWCLLWFDNNRNPVLSTVSEVYNVWHPDWVEPNTYGTQIVTCDIPKQYSIQLPQAVSLQSMDKCEQMAPNPSNILRVIKQDRESHFHSNRSIGICVQAFRFGAYDLSVRLVEWLEMVRLMGADKVYFYVYGATESMRKVLRYYQKEGLVDWRPLTLPAQQVNIESMYNYFYERMHSKFWPQELLELNDCLYRNLYRHDYLAVFDIDEMIMPQLEDNWHQLLEKIESRFSPYDLAHKGYYSNRNAYVYESLVKAQMPPSTQIPEYLFMMRHIYRDQLKPPGQISKSFQRTALTYAAHNHFAMRCLNTTGHMSCNHLDINPNDSFLMHYRDGIKPKCANTSCAIQDRTAWKYFGQLKDRVEKQLWQIFG